MKDKKQLFKQEVEDPYLVYNSLFMNLPYDEMLNIGTLIPLLYQKGKEGLENGKSPIEVMNYFFEKYTSLTDEKEQIDFLFTLIRFVERQVVLVDSVEDSAFEKLHQKNEKGTIEDLFQYAYQNKKVDNAKKKMENFRVRVVFTAHPTQFYPNNVLKITNDLQHAIQNNDIISINTLLQQLGQTPFLNTEKPSPLDEARSIMYYLRHVYYDAVSTLHQQIDQKFFGKETPDYPFFELGFWPGGDRDGNPFVTHDITKSVAEELRLNILKCYYHELKALKRKITFKHVFELLDELHKRIYVNMFGMKDDLRIEDIQHILQESLSIIVEKNNGLYADELQSFIRKTQIFGLYFASLDIRQDSSIHRELFQEITQQLDIKRYETMSYDEKMDFIHNQKITEEDIIFTKDIFTDTIENIKQIKSIQEKNGERAIHRYIISNSTTPFQILEVMKLFEIAGYDVQNLPIDIIPLFETMEGMTNCADTMTQLFQLPLYQKHLEKRGNQQTIMLGFSDGTKDGGYVKANLEIFNAKEKLTQVAEKHGIKVVFFDGRGGPPARGGGKTHQFYASHGSNIANHEIQLTLQGQTISSMYGSYQQALYNFSQLYTAGIMNDLSEEYHRNHSEVENSILKELAEDSHQKYQELKNHPKFISYLENRSTLPYYGKTNIGSRPSKRNASGALNLSNLRAIPFVGAWSQLKQNVPGYYGFGSALQKQFDNGNLEQIQAMYQDNLFFKTLVENSMMALCKCYFPLTAYMQHDAEFGSFWLDLYEEFQLSIANLLQISQMDELLQDSPTNKASIENREKIVLPLLIIQQYALQMIENKTKNKEVYEKMVTRSLFGNINASRNSA